MSSKNRSILVTAPSGAGKTTLVRMLLEEYPHFEFSVSATTRAPRPNEVHGKDYFFISEEAFDKMISNNEFLEWEEVYKGTKYGSIRSEIQKIWNKDHVAIFDIDIMGALRIKKELNQNLLSVFVAPPNMDVLYQRLTSRNTETPEKIKTRMDKATEEMRFQNIFDVKIINDEIHLAYQILKTRVEKFLNSSH